MYGCERPIDNVQQINAQNMSSYWQHLSATEMLTSAFLGGRKEGGMSQPTVVSKE